MVDGRNVYVTDHLGRVEHVEGRWDTTAAADAAEHRNGHQQRVAGRADRQPGDVGAHLIAASGGGGGEGLNLVALRDAINAAGGDYGKMEREIRRLVAQDPDVLIELRIDLQYPGSSTRPGLIVIDVLADGKRVGKVNFEQ